MLPDVSEAVDEVSRPSQPSPAQPMPVRPSPVRLATRLFSGAALGKALGFLRELEIARLLGAGIVTDGYRGAMSAVLLPLLPLLGDLVPATIIKLHRRWQSEGRALRMQSALCAVFLSFGLLGAALLMAFAAPWTELMLAGFGDDAKALTVDFIRIMALVAPALTLLACLAGTELSLGRSRITVLRAASQNIGVMIGIAVMAMTGEVLALAWGFVLGNHAVMLYGSIRLWREGEIGIACLRLGAMAEAGRTFFGLARPLLAIPVAEQAHQFVERLLSSRLAPGTLASVDYARTLSETAQYLVSLPLGYALLSRDSEQQSPARGRADAIIVPMLALLLPGTIFLALFAPDIIHVALARGAFGESAVASTAAALRGIAAGLWAATLGWVLLSMATAEGRSKSALIVMVAGYGTNILVNFALAETLGPAGIGLAEAARGLTLLIGAALALGCFGLLLRRVLQAIPPAMAIAAIGLAVLHIDAPPLARMALGGVVFGMGCGTWLAVVLPEARRIVWARLRRRS